MPITLENVEHCPVCGNTTTESYLECIDYTVSKETFKIVQCKSCTFTFTNPRPDENQIISYYKSDNYISHNDTNKGLINKVYHLVRQRTLADKLKLINKIQKKGYLLDIGCGTGSFLEVCKRDGWIVNGIEPDDGARQIAQQKLKSLVEKEVLQSFENTKFDVITLWHVLEHVHQLNKTIEKIKWLLNDNGKLIVAVPNVNSYDAQYFKKYWAAYDLPRHLYHFSKKTLQTLMQNHGIKLDATIPMKYDAFYIGLLSTKNKFNKISIPEGLAQGVKSNLWAKSNGNNYSSLTYIFSK